jgi:MATE family multidrug resistance protein
MTTSLEPRIETERLRPPAPEAADDRVPPAPTTGGHVREVALLAYPVILTQLSMTTMGVVDSAMVGQLGATELAAVGFGAVWIWTIFCCFIGTATAVQTFVAQHHGAGEPEACGAWAWQGFWALIPAATAAALVFQLAVGPLLDGLAPSEAVRPLAGSYMTIRGYGSVGMCTATLFAAFFRGIGDTRTPLYMTLLANGVNVVLDYALIFGHLGLPAWGVEGAAAATASAEWLYALTLGLMLLPPHIRRTFRTGPVRPQRTALRRLLRTGMPIGGQWQLEMLSFAVFLTLVARMGDAAMAASQAFIALLSLSFMQAMGIAIAVSTLVGRYIGARDVEAAERSFVSGQKLALALSGAVGLLFLALPGPLLRVFSDDPEVLRLGAPLLAIGALFQLFDAFGIVADGALRGAGDTRWPFLVRCVLAWGLFVPLAWLLGGVLEGGLTGAWLGGIAYVLLLSGYLVRRFRSGHWKAIRI